MSWKMNQQLRAARLAGQLPDLNFTEFSVLLIMTDTCRSESRTASISMSELEKLSGQTRVQMWRDVKRLIDVGLLSRVGGRGNQHVANRYEVLLPDAGCTDVTSTDGDAGCTGVTSTAEELVTSHDLLVTSDEELVTFEAGARYTHVALPDIPVTIPTDNPVEGVRHVSNARKSQTPPTREEQGLHPFPANQWIEPFKHCPAHPNDTTAPCIPCKIQRQEWEAWHDTYEEREAQYYRDHPEEQRRDVPALPAVIPTPANGQYHDPDVDLVTARHRDEADRRDHTDPGSIGEILAGLFNGQQQQQTPPVFVPSERVSGLNGHQPGEERFAPARGVGALTNEVVKGVA